MATFLTRRCGDWPNWLPMSIFAAQTFFASSFADALSGGSLLRSLALGLTDVRSA
jgi:hypothetical protein